MLFFVLNNFLAVIDFMTYSNTMIKMLTGRLRIKQLQLLIALDEQKSLHKAAAAMFMTQSAASKALQEVENMLSAVLFERTQTGLVPNALGHCAIRYAKLISTELNNFCYEVTDIQSGVGGRLAIGTIMGAIPETLVVALNWLHAAQPNLSIEIIEGTSRHLLSLLDNGQLDLMIGRSSVSAEPFEYNYYPLSIEAISVVIGAGYSGKPKEMTFHDLQHYRWIAYPKKMPLRVLLEKELDLAGLASPVNPIETASTFTTIAILQKSTDIIALLPTDVANMFVQKKMIKTLPVQLQTQADTFGIVTRKGGKPTTVTEQFIRLLREHALAH